MNCPKCGTTAQAGAAHCKRCGTPLAAKAKAAAAAAAPSSSDEIELMPLETAKPSYNAYEAPPGLEGVPAIPLPGRQDAAAPESDGPPPPDAPVRKIRGAMSAPSQLPINKLVYAAVGVLLLLVVGWMMFRTKNEVKVGKPKLEKAYTLNVGHVIVEDVEVTGVVPYTLEITVSEGELLAGVMKRNPKDSRKLDAIKSAGDLEILRKGDVKTFTGEFRNKEQWSWILANDTKKPARLKVKFQTSP
jgi:hypothetical protein